MTSNTVNVPGIDEVEAGFVTVLRDFVDREVRPVVRRLEQADTFPLFLGHRGTLARPATGELRATMALTEPGGGSDLQACALTATETVVVKLRAGAAATPRNTAYNSVRR